jgi:hypothetical protein
MKFSTSLAWTNYGPPCAALSNAFADDWLLVARPARLLLIGLGMKNL